MYFVDYSTHLRRFSDLCYSGIIVNNIKTHYNVYVCKVENTTGTSIKNKALRFIIKGINKESETKKNIFHAIQRVTKQVLVQVLTMLSYTRIHSMTYQKFCCVKIVDSSWDSFVNINVHNHWNYDVKIDNFIDIFISEVDEP